MGIQSQAESQVRIQYRGIFPAIKTCEQSPGIKAGGAGNSLECETNFLECIKNPESRFPG